LPDAPTVERELGAERRVEKGDWTAWRVPVRVDD
jgi:hypothetical protein